MAYRMGLRTALYASLVAAMSHTEKVQHSMPMRYSSTTGGTKSKNLAWVLFWAQIRQPAMQARTAM